MQLCSRTDELDFFSQDCMRLLRSVVGWTCSFQLTSGRLSCSRSLFSSVSILQQRPTDWERQVRSVSIHAIMNLLFCCRFCCIMFEWNKVWHLTLLFQLNPNDRWYSCCSMCDGVTWVCSNKSTCSILFLITFLDYSCLLICDSIYFASRAAHLIWALWSRQPEWSLTLLSQIKSW